MKKFIKYVFSTLTFITLSKATTTMDCGSTPYCGVLVLERGGGSGVYSHEVPCVHGLWPETGEYGDSKCVKPGGNPVTEIPSVPCYKDVSFQNHEWITHGICAANSPEVFFTQVCNLSNEPLKLMVIMKSKGDSLSQMVKSLSSSGYSVYNANAGDDQLELSVCAGSDMVWKLSSVEEFGVNCR